MTLTTIHKRLDLFPQYLAYRADNWRLTPSGKMYEFEKTGLLWICSIMSFDEWLLWNGHEELREGRTGISFNDY